MTTQAQTYRFIIDGYTPGTLPMARLAEYIADLARLLGETDHVHFVRVDEGSAALIHEVDATAASSVRRRLEAARNPGAPTDIAKPFRSLNERLREAHASARLEDADGGVIVPFPGRDDAVATTYGPFRETGTFDGVLIRVGGRDATVPVHLQDRGRVHICHANRGIARQLATHLFGPILRVHGEGRWRRGANGVWKSLRFDIQGFRPLEDATLQEVVEDLRAVQGSGWKDVEKPARELRRLRGETIEPD